MDNSTKKQFNKKRFMLAVITVVMLIGVNGECEKILKYSHSPVGMFMSGLGSEVPFNMIWIVLILLLMPFLILGIVFVKKWKDFKNG